MRLTWILLMLVLGYGIPAIGGDSKIKSWKTLSSDYGYEIKYPDCWNAESDDLDERDFTVTEAHDVYIYETKACARPLLDPPRQNSVGISAGREKAPSKKEVLKALDKLEKKHQTVSQQWPYFKRFKVGSNEAYVDVRYEKDVDHTWMYWEMTLYCPTHVVEYSGPKIKNPDPSYFEKFKNGDIAMPEPEKTIFESIRCVDSKK